MNRPPCCHRSRPRAVNHLRLLILLVLATQRGSLIAEAIDWELHKVECLELRRPGQPPASTTPSPPDPPITALAFTDRGQWLWTASLTGIDLWSWPQLVHTEHALLDGDHITRLRPAPDDQHLAAVGGSPGESGKVWRFSASGQLQWQRQIADDLLTDAAWSHDGLYLVATDIEGQLHWLAAETGEPIAPPTGYSRGLLSVACLPGSQVVVGGLDHTLQLHAAIGSRTAQRSLTQHTAPVIAIELALPSQAAAQSEPARQAVAAGGEPLLVSIGGDRTVRFWQPLRGRMVRFYRLERADPTCLAWSEPLGVMLVGDASGHLSVIEPATGRLRWSGSVGDSWHFAIAPHPTTTAIVFGATRGRIFVAHLTAPQHDASVP